MQTAGTVITYIGLGFMAFGVVGLFRFNSFYSRLVVSSKVDTVGALTLMVGLMLRHGISWFSAKLVIIIVIMLILNPLVAHTLASSAHASGYELDGKQPEEEI